MPTPQDHIDALKAENRRLHRAVAELSLLNELAHDLATASDTTSVINRITARSVKLLKAEQGVVTLFEAEQASSVHTLVRADGSGSLPPMHADGHVIGWMQLHRRPLVLNAPREDPRFHGIAWADDVRTLLCVPLMTQARLIGVLMLYNKHSPDGFSNDDARLLSIIASQSAQVIDNARLSEQQARMHQMQRDLDVAQEIQANLLPRVTPPVPGYELAGCSTPAQEVGGDFFDFVPLPDHRLALCVGDVAGKGLPASLLMANTQATLRSLAPLYADPADTVEAANRLVYESTTRNRFVTLFYGVLDLRAHTLSFVNAGHERPVFCTATGEARELVQGGLVLGAMPETTYTSGRLHMAPGDVLLVYSDGLCEAMNAARQTLGREGLLPLLEAHHQEDVQKVLHALTTAVHLHRGTVAASDDLTLLALKRHANNST